MRLEGTENWGTEREAWFRMWRLMAGGDELAKCFRRVGRDYRILIEVHEVYRNLAVHFI
jgi:hypothetical protein